MPYLQSKAYTLMTDKVYEQMREQQEQSAGGGLIAPATNDLTGQLQTDRQRGLKAYTTHKRTLINVTCMSLLVTFENETKLHLSYLCCISKAALLKVSSCGNQTPL